MTMEKYIKEILMAALLSLSMFAGMTSCRSDEESSFKITSSAIENYLYEKKWFLYEFAADFNKKTTEYIFFRNHLVMSHDTGGNISSGMLTYNTSRYFGTWCTEGDKLITTFTTGTYEDVNLTKILYGTLTVIGLSKFTDEITCTDPNGETRYLKHNADEHNRRIFTDYTDASDHDRALQGTWKTTVYKDGVIPVAFTITINKKGMVRFASEGENIDFTTTCTTKSGHVVFTHFLIPNGVQTSFIYVRTDKKVEFFSEENAGRTWQWEMV